MKNIMNIVKMDMLICRRTMLIMIGSMAVAGIGCLFFLTPLLLGFFVVGSTAAVSAIFAMEMKSNMDFLYNCIPVKKSEYVIGRAFTCLFVISIPAVIALLFTYVGFKTSLCQIEDVQFILEMTSQYQMQIMCVFIMLSFMGGANLLVACFSGKIESREILAVLLLIIESFFIGIIIFMIQKIVYKGNALAFIADIYKFISENNMLSCILILFAGVMFLVIGMITTIRIIKQRKL